MTPTKAGTDFAIASRSSSIGGVVPSSVVTSTVAVVPDQSTS